MDNLFLVVDFGDILAISNTILTLCILNVPTKTMRRVLRCVLLTEIKLVRNDIPILHVQCINKMNIFHEHAVFSTYQLVMTEIYSITIMYIWYPVYRCTSLVHVFGIMLYEF